MSQEDEKSGFTLERIRALIPLLTRDDMFLLWKDIFNEMDREHKIKSLHNIK